MEKRLVLAIALSILVIVSFQYLFVKPSLPPPLEKPAEKSLPIPGSKEPSVKEPLTRGPLPNEEEINLETDKYILTFSDIGGAIKKIRLKS